MSLIVVVGAGLAGLACAQRLIAAGRDVVLLEGSDAVGGRVRTDEIDGFRCDRGFQLINPAYPALGHVVDIDQLDLRSFGAGVVVAGVGGRSVLADPRRLPRLLPATLRSPVGSWRERAAFVRWALSCLLPVRRLLSARDLSLVEALDRAGISGELRTAVLDPFLAGVLADWDGTTSANFARLLMRSFLLGSPAVPSTGISRLPELLAASLPAGTIRLDQRVIDVSQNRVRTNDQEIRADAVVVATSPRAAAELTGIPMPATKPLTTFWHTAPRPPSATKLLHLDGARRGPLVNSAVVTNVAPGYAPPGRVLIASSTVAADGSADAEAAVRRQAGLVYGVGPADWELVTCQVIAAALPHQPPPLALRQPARLASGVFIAGDHRDTASIQGALVSGRRAADAVTGGTPAGGRR
ncbi:MAG TPA: NAD(P)/FAD-dependent oxidoreductase [Microlunatus sp.]